MFENNVNRAKPFGFARNLLLSWGLIGGLFLIAVVLINAWSISVGTIINKPFAGDFELTEMGVAIAVFCFLPYCQLVGANVTADIFTMRAGQHALRLMSIASSLIAVLFSALLLWTMSAGLLDYIKYSEFTGILQIPIWWAFIPIVISLSFLVLASLITLRDSLMNSPNPE